MCGAKREVGWKMRLSLTQKIVFLYIVISIIPTILITLMAGMMYSNSLMSQAYNFREQNAAQYSSMIKERMDLYENVFYELISDLDYIELAEAINSGDESSLLVNKNHMETVLEQFVYTYNGIRSVSYLADNNEYVSFSKWYGSSHEVIWGDAGQRQEIHDSVQAGQQKLTYRAMVDLSLYKNKTDYVVLMGYPVRNLRTKKQCGVLVIALEDELFAFAGQQPTNASVTTVIADNNSNVIAGVDAPHVNKSLDIFLEDAFGKKETKVKWQKIDGTDWSVVNIIDIDLWQRDIRGFVEIVFGITLVIACLFFGAAYLFIRHYITQIQQIAQGIRDFKGTGSEAGEMRMDEQDELYVIVKQFNQMVKRINGLVATLEKRNEEVRVAAMNQKDAEIKALEAQINPHFLYNTLDSINWRAIEHDEEEISDMLGALGSLLRYSVSNIDMVVVLEAEISWLKKYVFLQRDRFHNSFDCVYDVTPEAMGFPVYKMLLQPIVENAILHAFEAVKEGGLIEVRAFVREDGKLWLAIRDNGAGMDGETLQKIRDEIASDGALDGKSIGISNIVHRLKIYYRNEALLTVESRLGEGSEFVMILPARGGGLAAEDGR